MTFTDGLNRADIFVSYYKQRQSLKCSSFWSSMFYIRQWTCPNKVPYIYQLLIKSLQLATLHVLPAVRSSAQIVYTTDGYLMHETS